MPAEEPTAIVAVPTPSDPPKVEEPAPAPQAEPSLPLQPAPSSVAESKVEPCNFGCYMLISFSIVFGHVFPTSFGEVVGMMGTVFSCAS